MKLKKKTIYYSGTHFLLGIDRQGSKVWLEDFSWDCGWYWGGGYLHTFTNNSNPEASRDISSHYHFDGINNGKNINLFDAFNEHFTKSVLSENEIWQLCDLMKSFYTMRESAEWFKDGKSNYTTIKGAKARPKMAKLCNWIIENEIIPKVKKLLTP
jgi:hypothetical protein